jgi:hypothetical protein
MDYLGAGRGDHRLGVADHQQAASYEGRQDVSLSDLRERRHRAAERRVMDAFGTIDWCYGLDVMRRSGMRSGRFYQTLDSLESVGWVESKWADLEPGQRHRRRLYRLTWRPGSASMSGDE